MADPDTPNTSLLDSAAIGEDTDVDVLKDLEEASPSPSGQLAITASHFTPPSSAVKTNRDQLRRFTRDVLRINYHPQTETDVDNQEDIELVNPRPAWSTASSSESESNADVLSTVEFPTAQRIFEFVEHTFASSSTLPILDISSSIPRALPLQWFRVNQPGVSQQTIRIFAFDPWGRMIMGNNAAEEGKEREQQRESLVKQVNMLLLQNQMFRDMADANQMFTPINAQECELSSTINPPKNYKIINHISKDHRLHWTDGFDTKLFSRSVRLLDPKATPLYVKYLFKEPVTKFIEYHHEAVIYSRNRCAFNTLLDSFPAHSSQPSDEFWEAVQELFPARQGCAPASAYKLTHHTSTWSKFYVEVMNAARVEADLTKKQVPLFKNWEHKSVGLFLQDVIISNEMEHSFRNKVLWYGVKPGRSSDYKVANDALTEEHRLNEENARDPTSERPERGTFERDEKGELSFKTKLNTIILTLMPDGTLEEDKEREDEAEKILAQNLLIAELAKQQLLEEYEKEQKQKTRPSQTHTLKRKQKQRRKNIARGNKSTTITPADDVTQVSSDAPADPVETREPPDDLEFDKTESAENVAHVSQSERVITQADFIQEDDPINTSVDTSEKWKTVKHPSFESRKTGNRLRPMKGNPVQNTHPVYQSHGFDTSTAKLANQSVMQPTHSGSSVKPRPLSRETVKSEIFDQKSPDLQKSKSSPTREETSIYESGVLKVFDELEFPSMPRKSPTASEFPERSNETSTATINEDEIVLGAPLTPGLADMAHEPKNDRSVGISPSSAFGGDHPDTIDTNVFETKDNDVPFNDSLNGYNHTNSVDTNLSERSDEISSYHKGDKGNLMELFPKLLSPTKIGSPDEQQEAVEEATPYRSSDVSRHSDETQLQVKEPASQAYNTCATNPVSTSEKSVQATTNDFVVPQPSIASPNVVLDADATSIPIVGGNRHASQPLNENRNYPEIATEPIIHGSHDSLVPALDGLSISAVPFPSHAHTSDSSAAHSINTNTSIWLNATPVSEILKCTFCLKFFWPRATNPLYLCPGCGPELHAPRYCSMECLLVDALEHSEQCARYSGHGRFFKSQTSLPHCVYEDNPLVGLDLTIESPEMFRQRTFSLFCRYGKFPRLSQAWCRRVPQYPYAELLCRLDDEKRTGIYHVFESGSHHADLIPNPAANVLFTITLENGDPLKPILSRCLHSLFVHKETCHIKPITHFVFRAISYVITTPELFNRYGDQSESAALVLKEFHQQFYLETGFHQSMMYFGERPFDLQFEATLTAPYLNRVEATYPLLLRWAMD